MSAIFMSMSSKKSQMSKLMALLMSSGLIVKSSGFVLSRRQSDASGTQSLTLSKLYTHREDNGNGYSIHRN